MTIIKKYRSKVTSIIQHNTNVFTVVFEAEDRKKYKYKPGQFLHLAIDHYEPSAPWPESRCFSIQTSPKEKNLAITYSVKGAFTKRMSKELKVGKPVVLKLPYGELFSHHNSSKKSVFIAGGTGITPFLSLFNDTSFSEFKSPILFYGIKCFEQHYFHSHLSKAIKINSSFVVEIVSEKEKGFIDIDEIFEKNDNTNYYISGPPQMIKSFRNQLIDRGIAQKDILTDDWE